MSTTTAAHVPSFLAFASFRRLTVDEYHRMIRAGILVDGEPIELLEGYMVQKMPRGTPHDSTMDELDVHLGRVVPDTWFVRSQRAVTLADSEPGPDYAVVRGPRSRYRGSHPTPAEIGLVVEVSSSSLGVDRTDKARIYGRAGVPAYWVVNLVDRKVEVFTAPTGPAPTPGYGRRDEYTPGQGVPVALDGVTVGSIPVADILA